jgi:hypothetical protein
MLKAPITALILFGLFSLDSAAQSLPDIARQVRAQRSESRTGPIFTNENIAQAGANLATGSAALIQEAPAASSAPTDAPETESTSEATVGGRTEQDWRDAFSAARAEITRSENLA